VNRSCVWDSEAIACYSDNVTTGYAFANSSGPIAPAERGPFRELVRRYAWNDATVAIVCIGSSSNKVNIAAIVGAIIGSAAACMLALAVLAFVIFQRMKGNTLVPGGNADVGLDAALESPIYMQANNGRANPLFDAA